MKLPKILLIDNYDSFTFNIVQCVGMWPGTLRVIRNDEWTVGEIEKHRPDGIIISPGPCTPNEAGVSVPLIRRLSGRVPIFGVCLGHQSIGAAFGGDVVRAGEIVHGKTSRIRHDSRGVFRSVANPFIAMRYHSLVISPRRFPSDLIITARSEKGLIMGVRHRTHDTEGVQFHPESFATAEGPKILRNFYDLVRRRRARR